MRELTMAEAIEIIVGNGNYCPDDALSFCLIQSPYPISPMRRRKTLTVEEAQRRRAPYTTVKETLERIEQQFLNTPGHTIEIKWYWSGRNRNAAVHLMKDGKSIVRAPYARHTSGWCARDVDYRAVRQGTAKHCALQVAFDEYMEKYGQVSPNA